MAPQEFKPRLRHYADMPLPPGGRACAITTEDGLRLRVGLWPAAGVSLPLPGKDEPADALPTFQDFQDKSGSRQGNAKETASSKGTVVLVTGRTEFIEKYAEVIGELIERGFCVAALDWRGQGGSERLIKSNPRKGHVDHMDAYVADLEALLDFLDKTGRPDPVYCLAHSTGGQALIRAAPRVAGRIRRAVLTAPYLDLAPSKLSQRWVYRVVSFLTYCGLGELYAPGTSRDSPYSSTFDDNVLTSDPDRYRRLANLMHAENDLVIWGPTNAWVYATLQSSAEIRGPRFVASIGLPMVLLSASDDKVVSSRSIERFAAMVRTATHVGVPGARHDIMMERDEIRAQFWAAFDAFIPAPD